jgi:gluconokinase
VFVSVDVGSSSVKVALVNSSGEILRVYSRPIELYTGEEGAAEHDMRSILVSCLDGIKYVVKGFESKIEAISLSNYLHGLLLVDKRMNPITRVFTHMDVRSGVFQDALLDVGRELYERTGCPPLFVYPLVKLLWLRARGVLSGTEVVSFVKDYVIWALTGIRALDYGTASGTGLMNIRSLKWDTLALEVADISEENLPQLVEGARVLEYVTLKELGLEKVAVVPGSFDGGLQNVGYNAYRDKAVLNLGSTTVVRVVGKDVVVDKSREMRFFCYYVADGYWSVGIASNNGMTLFEWAKKELFHGLELSQLLEEAGSVKPCSDGVLALPFIAGERFPFRDPHLRLTLLGLGVHHTRSHVVRALVEGVGFVLKTAISILEENGITVKELHCGGGGCSLRKLVEIIASITSIPVVLYREEVSRAASSLGSVVVAMRALGYTGDIFKFKLRVLEEAEDGRFQPLQDLSTRYNECYKRFYVSLQSIKQLYKSLHSMVKIANQQSAK